LVGAFGPSKGFGRYFDPVYQLVEPFWNWAKRKRGGEFIRENSGGKGDGVGEKNGSGEHGEKKGF